MVNKILQFLNKEISGLHEAAYLLGFFAIFSQLLALVRDRLFANYFGAGHDLDIYYAAFRIPDFIFVTVASLVSISVLIPFLIEKMSRSKEETKNFINSVFSAFFFIISFVCVAVFFAMPFLVEKLFSGFTVAKDKDDLILLSRILLLSPILLGISNFLGSITQMTNRFFIYALSPILYNVGIILGVIFLSPKYGVLGLVCGVIFGAVMHMAIQIPFVISHGLFPKIVFKIKFGDIKEVVLVSLPRALTISAPELARFFLIAIASVMAVGSISVFSFASNLQSVPLSIIAVSYSLAALPILTRHFVSGDKNKFMEQMIAGCRHVIFLSMPVMMLFIVLRAQIVRTILGSGEFSWSDTRLTAACLAIFAISLIPQSLLLLFVRAYYSSGNTKTPLIVNIFSASCMIFGGFVFTYVFNTIPVFQYFMESLFKVMDLPGSSVLMMPLAYSFGSWVGFIIYWFLFQKEFRGFSQPVLSTAFQSFSASIIMGFVAYKYLDIFDDIFNINTFFGIFMQGLLSGLIGIFCGIVLLKLLKNREIDEVWRALHKKFWKAKVIGPDPEVG
jgi:putative peptidoglycan lipid II flippase